MTIVNFYHPYPEIDIEPHIESLSETITQGVNECFTRYAQLYGMSVIDVRKHYTHYTTDHFLRFNFINIHKESKNGIQIHIFMYCEKPKETRRVIIDTIYNFKLDLTKNPFLKDSFKTNRPPMIIFEFFGINDCVVSR